jgi:hypothetical protein
MYARFAASAGLPADAPVRATVDAVHAMPYGRSADRTPDGALAQWRGTCSTKHALLALLLAERWPLLAPRLMHRVYLVDRRSALARYGAGVAATVPPDGLMDVHRYLIITFGKDITIDVTFPADPRWDGRSSMRLACGDGWDVAAGADPDADKAALTARYCDPAVREPFIAALAPACRS